MNLPKHTDDDDSLGTHESRLESLLPWLKTAGAAVIGLTVLWLLHTLLDDIKYREVIQAVIRTPTPAVLIALTATGFSYLALLGYDACGLRFAAARIPSRIMALAAFCGYALGNTVGLGVLTGDTVRLRVYTAAGLEPGQVALVTSFIAVAFGIGVSMVGATGLLLGAPEMALLLGTSATVLRMISFAMFGLIAGLLLLCYLRRQVVVAGRWHLPLPGVGLAALQLVFSTLDIAAAALVLWVLLPVAPLGFPGFLAIYAAGIMAGVVCRVPGGIGVFEAVMLFALRGHMPVVQLLGALLLYRTIYFIVPLFLAAGMLASFELRHGVTGPLAGAAARLGPLFMAATATIVGILLLASSATPIEGAVLEMLRPYVSLPLLEASHFFASIAAVVLLVVARGLLHRLDAAWWAALLLAAAGLVLTFPKGLPFSETLALIFFLGALLAFRHQFTRRASLFAQGISAGWLLAIACVVAAVSWLFFFAYREVQYTQELWWQFEFDKNAPRSLRAMLAAVLSLLGVSLWQLLRPATGRVTRPSQEQLEKAASIVRAQSNAESCLALMGDKSFLFSESGNGFLMFTKRGRTWVSLYDPVCAPGECAELIWRFIELANSHGGRAVFYQVKPVNLTYYIDAGLRTLKLGEYAHVPLTDFSLKGSARQELRTAINRGEREGLSMEVLAPGQAVPILTDLKGISDAWLEQHAVREKAFSLGAFDTRYLARLPLAVVRRAGSIIAFANLLTTDANEEVCVDLMRQLPDAPPGTMDYLFVRLMLHYQSLGYARFGLGMAPLAGMATHPLAPRWHRIGHLIFGHGEAFYNFRGLRAFKEKFDPIWEPRYLASPGGLGPVLALTDIAALTSGGLFGLISK